MSTEYIVLIAYASVISGTLFIMVKDLEIGKPFDFFKELQKRDVQKKVAAYLKKVKRRNEDTPLQNL